MSGSAFEKKDETIATKKSSSILLSSALAGMMCVAVASCSSDDDDGAAVVKPEVISKVEKPDYTLEQFSADCKTRNGIVQTHAACGGTNMCKGMSYSHGKLSEHTCKGTNGCAGWSCVETAADRGLSGQEIYDGSCSGCHKPNGTMNHLVDEHDTEKQFKLYVVRGADKSAAEAAFLTTPVANHMNVVAFGRSGFKADGTHYSNMQGFYAMYSLAEIQKVVEHVHTLTPVATEIE